MLSHTVSISPIYTTWTADCYVLDVARKHNAPCRLYFMATLFTPCILRMSQHTMWLGSASDGEPACLFASIMKPFQEYWSALLKVAWLWPDQSDWVWHLCPVHYNVTSIIVVVFSKCTMLLTLVFTEYLIFCNI